MKVAILNTQKCFGNVCGTCRNGGGGDIGMEI